MDDTYTTAGPYGVLGHSTSTPTTSYSTMCVSLSSGHKVRFWLNTHSVPSKSNSCEVCGHVQFATRQGKHFFRSNDGNVPDVQRIHDFCANDKPLGSRPNLVLSADPGYIYYNNILVRVFSPPLFNNVSTTLYPLTLEMLTKVAKAISLKMISDNHYMVYMTLNWEQNTHDQNSFRVYNTNAIKNTYMILICFYTHQFVMIQLPWQHNKNESIYVSEIESLSTCSFLYFNKNAARNPNGSGDSETLDSGGASTAGATGVVATCPLVFALPIFRMKMFRSIRIHENKMKDTTTYQTTY
ncbi:hypothetical protein AGLY_002934 [Aphis glycines]|uniref:Uncharacterized protein n=1 Tax=Aphis glycines TaxID=307491 RepID=A0A6G0U256_APHGL|nr:hypothetical protein AGLY_002934 [Aphis glycines]